MENLKESIRDLDIKGKKVLIIGFPASGKTTLSELLKLKSEEHEVMHSDDYMKFGFVESLYELMKDLEKTEKPTIVEGVIGYRLLRKGVELDSYYPDIVIELNVNEETIKRRYLERDPQKIKGALSMCKSSLKILSDYRHMPKKKVPMWVDINND